MAAHSNRGLRSALAQEELLLDTGATCLGADQRHARLFGVARGDRGSAGSELFLLLMERQGSRLTAGPLIASCARPPQRCAMAKLSSRRRRPLPLMVAELMMASWETMARRSLMMLQGTCPPAEYQRMATEKAAAMQLSALAVWGGRSKTQALAPWHKRATANAKRLRRAKS